MVQVYEHFSGQLYRPDGIGTWTYVAVPFDAEAAFGRTALTLGMQRDILFR